MKVVTTVLALTLLNPHVYLDTVVFLGSVAAQFATDRWWFALGASLASFGWFFGLAYGAKQFAAAAKNPRFWRVLDSLIALIMFALALSLILMH